MKLDMPKPIRSNSKQQSSRSKKERSTWRKDRRRSSHPRPSSSRSNRTRWTPSRRSSRPTWTKDWSSERPSTTNCSKDIRTSRRKLTTNKQSKEPNSRSSTPTWPPEDPRPPRVQWWDLRWVPQEWWRDNQEWELLATQPPSHPTCEDDVFTILYKLPSRS